MLIAPENAPDVATLRALMLAAFYLPFLIGMAGGSYCCCDHGDSSTSSQPPPPGSTSTSTSTGDAPPLPPRPGSTSTADPPTLPPTRRSSTVGPIATVECLCCLSGTAVDQWQIEVSGVTNPVDFTGFDSVNGVWIIDGLAPQISGYHAACSTATRYGCGNGDFYNEDEPTDFSNIEHVPSASIYEPEGWQFFPACYSGVAANTQFDILSMIYFWWENFDGNQCGPSIVLQKFWKVAPKPIFAPIFCSPLYQPDTIDCASVSGCVMEPVTPTGATAIPYYVEGF
jgi:hypothetical protein